MQHRSWQRFALSPLVAALVVALVAPLALPVAALADDAAEGQGVGVARLSVVDGNVAIQRGDSNSTVDAVLNAPVLGADYVTTGPQSRAEVQFDGRTVVRLGENVQMRFSHIEDGNRQLQLAAGTIDLRLLRGTDGQSAIDTPSISVIPRATGSYRISVDGDGTTFVTVRSGHADITTPQGAQPLDPGSTLVAQGTASNPQISNRDDTAYDSFDAFNRDRDQAQLAALNDSPYVNNDIDGVSDLGAYGRWVDDGTYGHVWIPNNVPVGWAPYRTGNWVWEDGGYGWTWVAAEPWGWAPYHYGRWYYSAAYSHWCWYPPGPAAYAPAWSPALVGFIGLSIGAVSIGIGFGHVGWVPLAPYEAFHPWWGPHATVYNNVTINRNVYINNTNVNVTRAYRNVQYNAVSSVSVENFRAGRFGNTVAVTSQQLAAARPVAVRGPLPVVPTANNLRFAEASRATLPQVRTAAFTQRSFAGTGAVAQRTPFVQQQATVARVTHTSLPSEPVHGVAEYARPVDRAPSTAVEHPPATTVNREPATAVNREPAGAAAIERTPSYATHDPATRVPSTVTGGNDPWARFNAAHGTTPSVNRQTAPAYDRAPTTTGRPETAPSYRRPANTPSDNRPETSPTYNRNTAPSYSRPATPTTPTYSRPETPAYSRPAAPTYSRPETPAYSRPAAPTYDHPAAPSYNRPTYSQPSYNRPTYSQPSYTQRAPEQRSYQPRSAPAAPQPQHGGGGGGSQQEHGHR